MNNFNPYSDDLTQMVQFAVQNNILKKESLLYKFMQDTVTQLNFMHNPSKKEGNNSQPKGMRWDALTIKFAVALAVKCKIKGFEVVRKWLPWPSWRIVQGYRQADKDVTPIDMNNCRLKTLCHLVTVLRTVGLVRPHGSICRKYSGFSKILYGFTASLFIFNFSPRDNNL